MDNFKKMIGEMKQAEQKEEGAAKKPDPNEMMKSGITRGQEGKVDAMIKKDGKIGNNRFLKKGNDGNYYSYGGGKADQKMDAGKLLRQVENQESAKAKIQQSIKDRKEAAKPKPYETEDETFVRTMKQNELSPEAKQEIREKAQQPKPQPKQGTFREMVDSISEEDVTDEDIKRELESGRFATFEEENKTIDEAAASLGKAIGISPERAKRALLNIYGKGYWQELPKDEPKAKPNPQQDDARKRYIDKFTKDLLEINPDKETRYFDEDALYDNVAQAFRGIGDEEVKSIVADLAKNLEANGFVNESKWLNPGEPQPQEPTVEQASDEELEDDYVDWYEYIYEDMPMQRRAEILAERKGVPVERAKALIAKLEEEAKRRQETLDRKAEESKREQEEIDKKEMDDLMRKLYKAKATNYEEGNAEDYQKWLNKEQGE